MKILMRPFLKHTGIAAPLIRDNIDTDQIIPSREMKTVSKSGLKDGLFAGQRYISERIKNSDFILNQQPYDEATILLSGKNFGCGSSREHAVWAMKDYGFRVVVAESYGEIFYNNCIRNGILAVQLPAEKIRALGQIVDIDLPNQLVDNHAFEIPAGDKAMLLEGLDAISVTLKQTAKIDSFFERDRAKFGWKYL